MTNSIDLIIVIILLTTLLALVTSRMMALIRLMALQGILVALVPVFFAQSAEPGAVLFAVLTILIKAGLIPALLYTALTRVAIRREVEPLVGYHASLLIGLGMMLLSYTLTARLGLALSDTHSLALIAAFTTISCGLFLMMSRTKALTQIIGYLILENGIYMVGATLTRAAHNHYIVEFGILLDLLVAVMLMGVIVYNINRTFDDMDTHQLEQLKD